MMKNCKDTDITGTLKTALIEQYTFNAVDLGRL